MLNNVTGYPLPAHIPSSSCPLQAEHNQCYRSFTSLCLYLKMKSFIRKGTKTCKVKAACLFTFTVDSLKIWTLNLQETSWEFKISVIKLSKGCMWFRVRQSSTNQTSVYWSMTQQTASSHDVWASEVSAGGSWGRLNGGETLTHRGCSFQVGAADRLVCLQSP